MPATQKPALTTAKLALLRKAFTVRPNKLKLAAEIAGVELQQVGHAIGVHPSQVSRDTRGRFADIPLTKARRYAEYFGCRIEDLFPGDSDT